ncbi:MAG: hypothetical protein COV79_04435 [Parcubacteria group bacterium CG11_big_fil_rev_8_21_14_0_20_41_14]|nr:MAG: hypothetical protein COV79_04435 [Parcubacteria group bacterium CG11_big_fil_rev_8_21_14_0_20_41_14]
MRTFLIVALLGIFSGVPVYFYCGGDKVAVNAIDGLVTDKVIEVAVKSFAEDMRSNWSDTENYGVTWCAGMKARHAVFAENLGEGWFGLVYYNRTDFRERAMKIAREALDTPEELRAAYSIYKTKLVSEIRKNGISNEVRSLGVEILPYFGGGATLSSDSRYERGEIAAYEWAQRRRAEGGDELVAAWGEIIADLVNSL